MGFHDFPKLDFDGGRKRAYDCGKWFRTPWISLPCYWFLVTLATAHQAANGKLNNHIFSLLLRPTDWKIMLASVSVRGKKLWTRNEASSDELNSFAKKRNSDVELKSIRLLEKLRRLWVEKLIFLPQLSQRESKFTSEFHQKLQPTVFVDLKGGWSRNNVDKKLLGTKSLEWFIFSRLLHSAA